MYIFLFLVFVQGNEDNVCGNDCHWSLNNENGLLIIKGTGEMDNYEMKTSPFYSVKEKIKKLQ